MVSHNGQKDQKFDRLSVFELSGKLFGIDITQCREVISLPRFTPLPNSEEIFLGVFNLRGEIFPLADISPILNHEAKKIGSDDMILLLENEGWQVGILVDKIHKVLTYAVGEVKLPRGYVAQNTLHYYRGVLENQDKLVYILNLKHVFEAPEMRIHI